jgi:hypothetical protein
MFEAIIKFRVPILPGTFLTTKDVQIHIDDLKEKFRETSLANEEYFAQPKIEVEFANVPCYEQGSFDFED